MIETYKIIRFTTMELQFRGTELEYALDGLKVSPLKVSLIWQAYQLSRVDPSLAEMGEASGITNILATIPSEYNVSIQALPDFIVPYAGSLLKYLAELIDGAEHELIVIAPYWSQEGVESLKRRLKSTKKPDLEVLVMTPANMLSSDADGLASFISYLEGIGASIRHVYPRPLTNNFHPQVHAKVIVSDSQRAYIGSANLSDNGLVRSIEVGVGIAGPEVIHLRNWFLKIAEHFTGAET